MAQFCWNRCHVKRHLNSTCALPHPKSKPGALLNWRRAEYPGGHCCYGYCLGAWSHESLPLATAPQRFPCRVGSYFPHAAAHGSRFVMVDNVRGSDAVTPGRGRRCARSGLASTQEVICSHSSSKGSLWVRRQPGTRFLLSCSRYRVWIVADGSGTLFSTRSVPAEQHSTEKTRRGADGRPGTKGK